VEAIIAVGYPGERKEPHGAETLEYGKVCLNRYGTPYEPGRREPRPE